MRRSSITFLLVAGIILAISASASAVACQVPDQTEAQETSVRARYVRVDIRVTEEDPESREYTISVFPLRVVVDADTAGVIWICHKGGVLDDCEIILDGDSADHFDDVEEREEGDEGEADWRKVIVKDVDETIFNSQQDRGGKAHSIMGAYSIRLTLRDGTVLNLDPDHEIDPRG